MIGTWVSILPPLIAIIMVFATKRVLLSLGAGIVSGALLAASFGPVESLKESMGVSKGYILGWWAQYGKYLYYPFHPTFRRHHCIR